VAAVQVHIPRLSTSAHTTTPALLTLDATKNCQHVPTVEEIMPAGSGIALSPRLHLQHKQIKMSIELGVMMLTPPSPSPILSYQVAGPVNNPQCIQDLHHVPTSHSQT